MLGGGLGSNALFFYVFKYFYVFVLGDMFFVEGVERGGTERERERERERGERARERRESETVELHWAFRCLPIQLPESLSAAR